MKTHAMDWALLVIRIAIGLIFMAHGAQKLFGWFGGSGLDRTIEMTGRLGFKPPMLFGVLLAGTEFFGGLFVLLGLLTRLSAFMILFTQLVAVAKIHGPKGFFLSDGGFEYNLSLIAMLTALVIVGSGAISLDRAFGISVMQLVRGGPRAPTASRP